MTNHLSTATNSATLAAANQRTTQNFLPVILVLPTLETDHQLIASRYLTDHFPQLPLANNPNLSWFNQERTSLKISQVRQILVEINYQAYLNQPRIIVLLQADLATLPAQQALLKTIEEPPANLIWILTVNQLSKILPTIQSRCQIINWSATPAASKITASQPTATDLTQPVTTPDFSTWQSILTGQTNYSAIIKQVEKYPTRDSAQLLTNQLLTEILTRLDQQPALTAAAQQLLLAAEQLSQNISPKLVLENCFFQLKKATS